ncbi:cell adhesion molecule CEACAM6-like [Clarias gariepinus]|uniref:carcinoembryonic antigen-related cell adhesion molecule 6-like n=1 Tax=Clarias gariepinus TaxID=13013 RepID=UPI00234DEC37|nr:carcinoembryonic antigen-related cell adhesion molecule 6-like [Clarias gariepinus]
MCFNNSVYRPAVSSAYSVHFLKLEFSRHGSFRGRSGAESVLVSLERRLLRSSGRAPDLLMDLHAVSCFLILLTCTGVCFGQEVILPEGIKIETGQDVEITPLRIPDPTPFTLKWLFSGSLIISVFPGGNITTSGYIGRVSVNTITLALKLRNLTESDTGQYTLSVDTDKGIIAGHTSLQVLVPASNVAIIPSNTELVEFNSTVSLVCSASGSSLSFIWLNGSFEVTAGERVQLTNSNSNLTITSVMRGDTGPYQCETSNSISNTKSPPLSLTVYYGPENVRVVAAPVGPSYSSGSNLILTCSADSSPAAQFQWAVNATDLGELGQELKLSKTESSHSGNYTCMAHNKQNLRNSTSEPISITVLGGL